MSHHQAKCLENEREGEEAKHHDLNKSIFDHYTKGEKVYCSPYLFTNSGKDDDESHEKCGKYQIDKDAADIISGRCPVAVAVKSRSAIRAESVEPAFHGSWSGSCGTPLTLLLDTPVK